MGSTRVPRQLLVTAFMTGTVLSLLWSWRPSLWTDEAATISASTRSLVELMQMARTIDAVHATYYVAMHGWLQLVPANAFALRLPSAVATGLTTVGVVLIGNRLGGARVGVLSAAVFVLLPRTTWMGVEARPFAASALLAVAATWVLLLLVDDDSARPRRSRFAALLVPYAALVGLGVAVNVYLGLLLVAQGITLLLLRVGWSRYAWWGLAGVAALAAAAPVVWTALHQTGQLGGGELGWFTWVRNVVVNQWFLGETPTVGMGGEGLTERGAWWKLPSIGLALLCWAVVGLGLLRAPLAPVVRWALPWVAVPTLVIGLYSVVVDNLYSARYFSYATAAVALLVGHGLAQLATRPRTVALLAAMGVLAAPVYVSQRQVHAKSGADWSEVASFVAAHSRPGDGVYFSPRYPIEGPVVLQTARGVATAYPRAFAGLVDVTLVRTAVEEDNLTGRSALLSDSVPRWSSLEAVWAIRRYDYADATEDERVLAASGFVPGLRWRGPLDEVVEYRRRAP